MKKEKKKRKKYGITKDLLFWKPKRSREDKEIAENMKENRFT